MAFRRLATAAPNSVAVVNVGVGSSATPAKQPKTRVVTVEGACHVTDGMRDAPGEFVSGAVAVEAPFQDFS